MNLVTGALPNGVGPRLRSRLYEIFGLSIGHHTTVWGPLRFLWYGDVIGNVKIGRHCFVSRDTVLDPTAHIIIGDGVVIGPQVLFLTATHDISGPTRRAGSNRAAPITVGNGVWIGARATILPGVHIGDGAVLGAATLVTRDVPANAIVGGVPARILRVLDASDPPAT